MYIYIYIYTYTYIYIYMNNHGGDCMYVNMYIYIYIYHLMEGNGTMAAWLHSLRFFHGSRQRKSRKHGNYVDQMAAME